MSGPEDNQTLMQSQEHRAKLLKLIVNGKNQNNIRQIPNNQKQIEQKHQSMSSQGQNYLGAGVNSSTTFTTGNQSQYSSSHQQYSLNQDQQSYYTASTVSPERQRNVIGQSDGQDSSFQSQNYEARPHLMKKDSKANITNTQRESMGRMVDLAKICNNQQVKSEVVQRDDIESNIFQIDNRFQINTGTFKTKKNLDQQSSIIAQNINSNKAGAVSSINQNRPPPQKGHSRKNQRMQLVDQVKQLLVSLEDRVAFLQRKGPINLKKSQKQSQSFTPKSLVNNNMFTFSQKPDMVEQGSSYDRYLQKGSSPLRQPLRSRSSSPQQHHNSLFSYQSNYKTKTDSDRRLNCSQILSAKSHQNYQQPTSSQTKALPIHQQQRPCTTKLSDITSSDIISRPYKEQIKRLNSQITQMQNISHKSKKQIRLLQGQLIMVQEQKKRHIQQNAEQKEDWQHQKAKLLQALDQSNKQNDQLKERNQHLKNQVENAKESVASIENQVKRLRTKFEEELKQQKKLISTQEKREKAKDEQHKERVKQLKSKYCMSQNELRDMQEKYKVDTARFQALLAGQRQTIESQKEKIKQLQQNREQEKQPEPPFQYNKADQFQNRFAQYYQPSKMVPPRPKSAAVYTTASSSNNNSKNTTIGLPKIVVSSKSPNTGAVKGIFKPPTSTNITKSQEIQIKKLQNRIMLGQSRQNKFFANRSLIQDSSKSPQMGDLRKKFSFKRNTSSSESELGASKKKFLYPKGDDEQVANKDLPKLRSNSLNNYSSNAYKSVENRGRQLYSIDIQDPRCKSTPKQRSSPLREPRKITKIQVPSIPRYSIDDQNRREQQVYKNLHQHEEQELRARKSLIKLKPMMPNQRNSDDSFTFALNSRDNQITQKQEQHYGQPLNENQRLKQKREKLKGVENEMFILQREIAGLSYLSRPDNQNSSQVMKQKQRRLEVIRQQRDLILLELF